MSASDLNSFRDVLLHEDLELYLRLCSVMKSDIAHYTQKRDPIPSDLACSGTLVERSREAGDAFNVLVRTIGKELADLGKVRTRFVESFAKAIKVDLNPMSPFELNDESVAQLSEAECKRALLIAVRVLEYARKITDMGLNQAIVFVKQCGLRDQQIRRWDEKASELAQEVDRLHVKVEAREQQITKMTTALKGCSQRLNALASTPQALTKGKPRALVGALEGSVIAAETMFKALHEKVEFLEVRLAEAETLEASCSSLRDATAEIENLQNQLRIASQNGQLHAARAEELKEKLQCSICMDRPKNVAFACGHTCCDQCASEWKRCPLNCKGPKSQKPVKHTFTLYL